MTVEITVCNSCGEEWVDGGEDICIFCESSDLSTIQPSEGDEDNFNDD